MIHLLIFDIDGTLTNGDLIYTNEKMQTRIFNAKDGLGIYTWNKIENKNSAFITGSKSDSIAERAETLGVKYVFQGVQNKKEKLDLIAKKENLSYENIAVIGDDLNDYEMLNTNVLSFCPKDASFHIKEISDVILKTKGGRGAGREMIEYILKRDPKTLKKYLSYYIKQNNE